MSTTTSTPLSDPQRAARLRRANVRLAIVLGLVATAVYVGFVLSGVL